MHHPGGIQDIRQFMQAAKPCVLVFRADWCSDCRYIEPFMSEVVAKFAEDLDFVSVDRDEFPALAEELGILGVPSFVVFRGGRELVRFVSQLRKTREEIESFLSRAVQVAQALPPEAGNSTI